MGKLVVGLVVVIFGLIGWVLYCEFTEPKSGTVTDKDFMPMFVTTSCTGKMCTSTVHPECYEVKYKNNTGDTGDACVSELEYVQYRKGDHYPKER